MPQLLHDKIAELQALAEQTKDTLAKASENLQATNAKNLVELQNATLERFEATTQATQATLKAHIAESLAQSHTDAQSAIKRELTQAKSEFRTEFGKQLESELQKRAEALETKALQQLTQDLPPQLTESLKADESLQESLAQHAKDTAREVASSQDFAAMIDHSKIPADPIANALKNDKALQESLKLQAKDTTQSYLASPQAATDLQEILTKSAKDIYKNAIKADELIRDRYESALRLQCFKIYGTQELVEEIIKESARLFALANKPTPPPTSDPVRNNILVVG